MLANEHNSGKRRVGRSVPGCPGLNTRLECRGNAIPQVNVVSYEVITDRKRTPIIGSYLQSSTLEYLPNLEVSLTHFWNQYPIVIGDLSANIGKAHNLRS